MLWKKKRLLNIRYLRSADSTRLLDKQFSITDRDTFSVAIKDSSYLFSRQEKYEDKFFVSSDTTKRPVEIASGGKIRLQHKDGTYVEFTLHKDFLYSLDYSLFYYAVVVILMQLAMMLMIPKKWSEKAPVVVVKEQSVDDKRIAEMLKKIEQKKLEPPKPKVAEKKPEPPKPKPEPKVAKKEPPKPTPNVAINNDPKPTPRKESVKISNDKMPPQRLVVQVGPPKVGGTGPANPNAKADQAARSQAKAVAMTKAKVSSALGFLAKGKGLVNVPPGGAANSQSRFIGGRGLAGDKNVTGKNFLAKISDRDVTGSNSGPIETSGSRTIATGAVISDGEINGVTGGKALNYVQGKVSVEGLHAAGGSGSISFGPSRSMSVQGNIDNDAVKRAILAAMGKLQYCYERGLLAKPGMAGLVQMKWTITPGGGVGAINVATSQLNNGSVHDCLMGVIRGIRFPSPKGGPANVEYPFDFKNF